MGDVSLEYLDMLSDEEGGVVAECRGWWAMLTEHFNVLHVFVCFFSSDKTSIGRIPLVAIWAKINVHRIYQTMYGKNNNQVSKLDILWNQMRGARGLPFPMIILLFDGRNQSTSPMHVDLKFIGTPIILAFIWLNSPILQLLPSILEVSKEVYRTEAMSFLMICFRKSPYLFEQCAQKIGHKLHTNI